MTNFKNDKIEELIKKIVEETELDCFDKLGKNFYIFKMEHTIRITINLATFRVLTVDKITLN